MRSLSPIRPGPDLPTVPLPLAPVPSEASDRARDTAAAVLGAYGGGWQASLDIGMTRVAGRTVASHVSHAGPLRMQKVLWPEGPELAHLILLHPPSGLAGGDSLALTLTQAPDTRVLLTTPGAGRWYRADSPATQTIDLRVGGRGSLEWLPQETVLHDGVQGVQHMTVDVAPDAAAIGMDILVLGRKASGEHRVRGDFRSHLTLRRADRLLLSEVTRVGRAEQGIAALGRAHVSGLLWAVAPAPMHTDLAEAVEAALDASLGASPDTHGRGRDGALAGVSVVDPHLLLVRAVGESPEQIRHALAAAWAVLRPILIGRAAVAPRIWMT
jgi:urease accessory protein